MISRNVGILHWDPQFTAKQIRIVYFNLDKWWYSAEVREVRKVFLDNFAAAKNKFAENA